MSVCVCICVFVCVCVCVCAYRCGFPCIHVSFQISWGYIYPWFAIAYRILQLPWVKTLVKFVNKIIKLLS